MRDDIRVVEVADRVEPDRGTHEDGVYGVANHRIELVIGYGNNFSYRDGEGGTWIIRKQSKGGIRPLGESPIHLGKKIRTALGSPYDDVGTEVPWILLS